MKKLNLIVIAVAVILFSAANILYGQHEHNGTDTTKSNKEKDVVCGMDVEKNDSLKVLYNEKDYFFCSKKDMLAFLKQPQKYTDDSMQNHSEHNMDHGMMGMSTPMMLIMGGIMVTAMIVGMSGVMK